MVDNYLFFGNLGGLGDCYFLSSLSVLAERENLIKRLFVTKDSNPRGCYSMWMC
jgi:calpain-15